MPRAKAIHTMVNEVFDKELDNDLIDEIVEERNFIVNTLKSWIETDEVWQQMVDDKEQRKSFLNNMQMLFLTELQNSTLIELATTRHGDK
jgi:DNA phosphorothioation-dependent restriction protein DptG